MDVRRNEANLENIYPEPLGNRGEISTEKLGSRRIDRRGSIEGSPDEVVIESVMHAAKLSCRCAPAGTGSLPVDTKRTRHVRSES